MLPRTMSIVLSLVAIAVAASSAASEAGVPAYRAETGHCVLEWSDKPDSAEIEWMSREAATLYRRVAELLGEQPADKITILLEGPAERADGRRDYPRVDSQGRIHLFKFGPDAGSYLSALAHEMVHAFRIDRIRTADWFFEEGFAEFVALRADPSLAGFPWFDFPVTIVAGQWVAAGQGIPLSALRERHGQLNMACRAQSYSLRSSFFDWLGRTHGDKVVIATAKMQPAGSLTDYEKFFGKPFEELEREWRKALMAEYRAIPDADVLAKEFRQASPIQYQPVCSAGKDF